MDNQTIGDAYGDALIDDYWGDSVIDYDSIDLSCYLPSGVTAEQFFDDGFDEICDEMAELELLAEETRGDYSPRNLQHLSSTSGRWAKANPDAGDADVNINTAKRDGLLHDHPEPRPVSRLPSIPRVVH